MARISTPGQDLASNLSQHEAVDRYLKEVYEGRIDIRRFSDQASGWLANRPSMIEVKRLIETGEWDLVMVGELREISRNPKHLWEIIQDCKDNETRFISVADNIDTIDRGWMLATSVACLRYGLTVPETSMRVERKATSSFTHGGMVLKSKFGYRKLSIEESQSGQFGPMGLRITKLGEFTVYLHGMRLRVLAGGSYEAIAEGLNEEGVPVGQYVTGGKWKGRLVRDLLSDPILSGRRQFRKNISQLHYGKGKNRAKANPNPPEMQEYTELAHFTDEQHQELLAVMAIRKAEAATKQSTGRASSLYNVPRARSLWPGQHARCHACGGLMYRYGNLLKCQNALGKGPIRCWNKVLVRISEIQLEILPLVLQYLDRLPVFRLIITESAWREYQRVRGRQNRSGSGLDGRIKELEKQIKNLTKAIQMGGELESLVQTLASVEKELSEAKKDRLLLVEKQEDVASYQSAADLAADLEKAIYWLAETSRDFAEILRRLITSFVVYPVQALDTPQVHPRARITISAAAWASEGEEVPVMEATLDLFEPPKHIKHLARCVEAQQLHPEWSLRELETQLDVNYMTVKRALAYHQIMQQAGVTDPFCELIERPENASRWGKRQQKGDPDEAA